MKTTFFVQAQRSNGHAYVPCPVQRATSWAVIREDVYTRGRVKHRTISVHSRHSTRTQAQGMADANNKSFAPTPRNLIRKLGLRIVT